MGNEGKHAGLKMGDPHKFSALSKKDYGCDSKGKNVSPLLRHPATQGEKKERALVGCSFNQKKKKRGRERV